MAYSANTDYKSIQNSLKSQIDAETDAAKKAALQAQYDTAEQSRIEKMASDLTSYGKYATDSELNSAAGIMATNQIGTGYETAKSNLNASYDQAKQNVNNDALSRGMARSSFVSDRQANLDSQRANALQGVDAAKALAIQNATANILSDYRAGVKQDEQIAKQDLANQKTEFANTIGAYYNDYQAEINNVQGNNDPSDDWKIPFLQAARNQKILDEQEKAAKAAKTSGYSGGGGGNNNNNNNNNNPFKDNTTPVVLNDAAAAQAVGMNRTATGQLATVQRLYDNGQITEVQAQALINKFKLG